MFAQKLAAVPCPPFGPKTKFILNQFFSYFLEIFDRLTTITIHSTMDVWVCIYNKNAHATKGFQNLVYLI